MNVYSENGNIVIANLENFDLAQTLDCGQAFRWQEDSDGTWRGIAHGRSVRLQRDKDKLIIHSMSEQEFGSVWRRYFDLDRDYGAVISACKGNELLEKAARYGGGIRILVQEPWETLCSFIISQNNNIPRIKGIIERLCENFGKPIEGGYSFPEPAVLAPLSVEDLAPLRSGFRAKYILDAARKVVSGEAELVSLADMPYETAHESLKIIKGVGDKVADCTLLFGSAHIEAFPRDVWIKRVMSEHFPQGLPENALPYAGIVQQYLFYYARSGEINL